MCPAKSGRKDNIRRHVRNLHSESDDELRTILQKIFDNFNRKKNEKKSTEQTSEKRDEKTEKKTLDKPKEFQQDAPGVQASNELNVIVNATKVVKNIATSVIKFVGRSQEIQTCRPVETGNDDEHVQPKQASSSQRDELSTISPQPTKLHAVKEVEQKTSNSMQTIENNTIDSIAEIGTNFPSLEPLNFDPFPDMTPLPMLNTNTNLSVYRQLLSPYLKKSENSSDRTCNTISNDPCYEQSNRYFKTNSMGTAHSNQVTPAQTMIIDRPPKKMIEKYEFYRK